MRIAEAVIVAAVAAGLSNTALAQTLSSAQPVTPDAGSATFSELGDRSFLSAYLGSSLNGRRGSSGEYGSGADHWGYGSAPYPFDGFDDSGKLRLHLEPKNAQVYVDGYYAGVVDDFDGHFQHLSLVPRLHHVEIVAPGYQSFRFDVTIETHHTITYRGTLVPSNP